MLRILLVLASLLIHCHAKPTANRKQVDTANAATPTNVQKAKCKCVVLVLEKPVAAAETSKKPPAATKANRESDCARRCETCSRRWVLNDRPCAKCETPCQEDMQREANLAQDLANGREYTPDESHRNEESREPEGSQEENENEEDDEEEEEAPVEHEGGSHHESNGQCCCCNNCVSSNGNIQPFNVRMTKSSTIETSNGDASKVCSDTPRGASYEHSVKGDLNKDNCGFKDADTYANANCGCTQAALNQFVNIAKSNSMSDGNNNNFNNAGMQSFSNNNGNGNTQGGFKVDGGQGDFSTGCMTASNQNGQRQWTIENDNNGGDNGNRQQSNCVTRQCCSMLQGMQGGNDNCNCGGNFNGNQNGNALNPMLS